MVAGSFLVFLILLLSLLVVTLPLSVFSLHSSLPPFRYCPECKTDTKEVIGAGEMRLSKKKARMHSKTSDSSRDWGKVCVCVRLCVSVCLTLRLHCTITLFYV